MVLSPVQDHKRAVDLFQDQDARHKVREGEVGELPADVGARDKGRRRSQGARDDESQIARRRLPAAQLLCEGLAVPVGAVQVEQDDEIFVPDLGQGALAFFFFGEGGFLFALYSLIGLVADFEDLYFDKGFQALGVFVLEHV